MSACDCCGERPGTVHAVGGRAILDEDTEGRTVDELRAALIDGGKVIEGLQSYVLVFGPDALIEAL